MIPDLGVFERLVSNLTLTFASHLGLDIGSAVFSCSRFAWCLRAQKFQIIKFIDFCCSGLLEIGSAGFVLKIWEVLGGEFLTSFQSS